MNSNPDSFTSHKCANDRKWIYGEEDAVCMKCYAEWIYDDRWYNKDMGMHDEEAYSAPRERER